MPARYALTEEHLKAIGGLVVVTAELEFRIQYILWNFYGFSEEEGLEKIYPNITGNFERLCSVLIHNIGAEQEAVLNLWKSFKALMKQRNTVVHAEWSLEGGFRVGSSGMGEPLTAPRIARRSMAKDDSGTRIMLTTDHQFHEEIDHIADQIEDFHHTEFLPFLIELNPRLPNYIEWSKSYPPLPVE